MSKVCRSAEAVAGLVERYMLSSEGKASVLKGAELGCERSTIHHVFIGGIMETARDRVRVRLFQISIKIIVRCGAVCWLRACVLEDMLGCRRWPRRRRERGVVGRRWRLSSKMMS
jgi:hypothetical protein